MTPPSEAGRSEARTRGRGRALYDRVRSYRRSWVARIQDALMLTLMEDPEARARVLRLVDALAGLPRAHFISRAAGLVREYTGDGMGGLPLALRAPLRMAASGWMPSLLTAQVAKAATRFVASRFIVEPDSGALERVLARLERQGRYRGSRSALRLGPAPEFFTRRSRAHPASSQAVDARCVPWSEGEEPYCMSGGFAMPSQTRRKSLWEAPASSNPSRKRLLSSMRQRLRSKAERAERGNVIRQRPSAVGVLPADWEYVTRIAPGMGEDPLMRLIKLGIGSPNTSDWR